MEKILAWKQSIKGNLLERVPFETEKIPQTLDQASLLIPTGAYTTFRTYNKLYALHFDNHLARLEETAGMMKQLISLDGEAIRKNLRTALSETTWKECRVRLTVNLESSAEEIYLFLEELHVPTPAQYRNGVRVDVIRVQRENPRAKLSGFLPTAGTLRNQGGRSVYELLMSSQDGYLLEGLTSNFFAVQGKLLRTADAGVLEGITRNFILDIAESMSMQVSLDAVRENEIKNLSEAFITSSSRGILPVVQINENLIGSGKPGEITLELTREFNRRLEKKLERI
jgi:branched-chain amino acid aminotransferase